MREYTNAHTVRYGFGLLVSKNNESVHVWVVYAYANFKQFIYMPVECGLLKLFQIKMPKMHGIEFLVSVLLQTAFVHVTNKSWDKTRKNVGILGDHKLVCPQDIRY